MKIKYAIVDGQAKLLVEEVDTSTATGLLSAYALEDRVWIFINSHHHFVLRQHYKECQVANIGLRPFHREEDQDFPIVTFNSTWEEHKPYIDILQKELMLKIEDFPS